MSRVARIVSTVASLVDIEVADFEKRTHALYFHYAEVILVMRVVAGVTCSREFAPSMVDSIATKSARAVPPQGDGAAHRKDVAPQAHHAVGVRLCGVGSGHQGV